VGGRERSEELSRGEKDEAWLRITGKRGSGVKIPNPWY